MSRRGRVSDFRRPIWTSVRRRWVDSRTWRCLSPQTQAVVELNRPKLTLDVAAIGQGPTMTTGSFRALSRRRQSDSARRQIPVRHSGLARVEPLLTQTETVVLTGGHRGRPRPEDRTAPHAQWTVTAGQGGSIPVGRERRVSGAARVRLLHGGSRLATLRRGHPREPA